MRTLDNVRLDLIIPVFNEEKNIATFYQAVSAVLKSLVCQSQLIFINDGSKDKTLEKLSDLAVQHDDITVINFTRNFGKEAAITAGLEYSTADICIPIDADLQHPPEVIIDLLAQWQAGFDHVIALRRARDTESYFKKISANWFYKLFNACSDFSIPNGAGDFRLMGRTFIEKLLSCRERNRFMKGLYAWVGGKTATVFYDVQQRAGDKSSFSVTRLFSLAFDAITSFTTIPLRLWSFLGVCICFFSGLFGCYLIIKKLVYDVITPGYTSLMVVLLFFGGIQLISLGIIGEYLSRLFVESKQRPLYLIDCVISR